MQPAALHCWVVVLWRQTCILASCAEGRLPLHAQHRAWLCFARMWCMISRCGACCHKHMSMCSGRFDTRVIKTHSSLNLHQTRWDLGYSRDHQSFPTQSPPECLWVTHPQGCSRNTLLLSFTFHFPRTIANKLPNLEIISNSHSYPSLSLGQGSPCASLAHHADKKPHTLLERARNNSCLRQ